MNLPVSIKAADVKIAEVDDYDMVIHHLSILTCYIAEGYVRKSEIPKYTAYTIGVLQKNYGISRQQVVNIIDMDGAKEHSAAYVENAGGCKAFLRGLDEET